MVVIIRATARKPRDVSPQFKKPKRKVKNKCKYCASEDIQKVEYTFHDAYECKSCKTAYYNVIEDCCRRPSERYVNDFHNGIAKFIRVQCDNCGGCLNMTKSLKRAEYGNKTKGEFSKECFLQWKNEKQSEGNELYHFSKHLKFVKSNFFKHRTHLQSVYWKNIRLLALERDKYTCQICKLEPAKDVHHLTYKNLGNELLEELISYCRACHKKVHEK